MAKTLSLAFGLLLGISAAAQAQVEIRPDPNPQLPRLPGEGLGLEDQRFLDIAYGLGEIEATSGALAAEKAANPDLQAIGPRIAAYHGEMQTEIRTLAEEFGATIAFPEILTPWRTGLEEIAKLEGEAFDPAFLRWQLGTHLTLVELFQQQASQTTNPTFSTYAITTLVKLQEHLDALRALAEPYGIEVDLVEQPPQY